MVFNACSTQFYSAQFVGLELLMLLVSARKLRWAFTSWKMQVLEEMWHVHVNLSQETQTVFACEALCHFRISVFLLSTQDHDRWHSSRAMRMNWYEFSSLNPLSHIEIRRESPALQSKLYLLDFEWFRNLFLLTKTVGMIKRSILEQDLAALEPREDVSPEANGVNGGQQE